MQIKHKKPLLSPQSRCKMSVNPEQTKQKATLLTVVQVESLAEFDNTISNTRMLTLKWTECSS